MNPVRSRIKEDLKGLLAKHSPSLEPQEIPLTTSTDSQNGDYSTSLALQLAKKVGDTPQNIATTIKKGIEDLKPDYLEKVEVAGPGFINFYLSQSYLINRVSEVIKNETKAAESGQMPKVILEFGDPNPFKQPHIGHLRIFAVGESYARLLEATGSSVARVNYQGDVGLHVAKALWGIIKLGKDKLEAGKLAEKIKFLGEAYALGAKAYEEDEAAKAEIHAINKKVYSKDPETASLWEKGRQVSLDYFEEIYKRVGIKYEKYYFESQTALPGKEIVEKNTPKVFEKHEGAVVFRGEPFGLHTRVFLTSEGNPMYEAKDLALAKLKDTDFDYEKSYIITANEQVEYFKVILKALSLVDSEIAQKTRHFATGFVNLKEGKMSSRSGNVVSAVWLIEEAKKKLKESFKDLEEETLEKVAVGAIKYSMLKFGRESDIKFSFEDSINLNGNSGPYLQYTFARTKSLLSKSPKKERENFSQSNLATEELAVIKSICHFDDAVLDAMENFEPNILANYLYHLAQQFNLFYQKHKIVGSKEEDLRIFITAGVEKVLKRGLNLLGIEAPERI